MNRKKTFIFIPFIAVLLMGLGFQTSPEFKVLFEKAKFTMETKGDLNGAIKLFNEIIEKYPDDREYAAKSLLHIGLCYEKLGRQEAQKAYQRLIEEYPGQTQEVAMAKERLASLTEVMEKILQKPTFRKIKIPTEVSFGALLSPYGEKIALESDNKLWIVPLLGKLGPDYPGEPKILDTGEIKVGRWGFAWSGDGKWIAFNEDLENPKTMQKTMQKGGTSGIYIVSAEGGKPKKVYENYRGARTVNYFLSLSPNGKTVAFTSQDRQLHTISVKGGVPRRLTDFLTKEPAFSPDGKMIAFVKGDSSEGSIKWEDGLRIMPAGGGAEKLVADVSNIYMHGPTWSPDGNMIAFIDRKEDTGKQICIIPIGEDGEAAGKVTTIDPPEKMEDLWCLLGWTPDNHIGAIIKRPVEFGLYTMPAKGGMVTMVAHGGYPVQPRWSPDGKQIFHTNEADEGSGDWQKLAIAFVPAEGGKVTTVPIQLDEKIRIPAWGGGNRISPDGKTIVFSGETQSWGMTIWTLPVKGGKPKQHTKPPASFTDRFPYWSHDGKSIAFVRTKKPNNYFQPRLSNIYIVSLEGGEPKPLTSTSDKIAYSSIAWSPDGKLLAYFSGDEETSPVGETLKVIPVDGGEPRVVGKVQGIGVNDELAWSPDSKRIAFNGPKGKVIKVISLEDGNIEEAKPDLADTRIFHLDWSPDGKRLAFGGWRGDDREIWLMEDFMHLVKGAK